MSLFGQVWLWSVFAFALGVVITWAVLVRPIQARNDELERELAEIDALEELEVRFEGADDHLAPVEDPYIDAEYPASPAFSPDSNNQAIDAWPEQEESQEEHKPRVSWPEYDSLADRAAQESIKAKPKFFPDEPEVTEAISHSSAPQRSSFDYPSEPQREFSLESRFGPPSSLQQQPEPDPTPPMYAFGGGDMGEQPGGPESPAETTQVLPRRAPRQSPRGGFDAPQPIRPSMRAIQRREPGGDSEIPGGGSLFDPVPASNQETSAPAEMPYNAVAYPEENFTAPRGPFGPASALSLPGGGSPGSDFLVKASATALRYCTEDSPHFEKMVAEVWFRTPMDAERSGFRTLN